MKIALVGAELEENLALRYLAGAVAAEGHEPAIVRFDAPRDEERAAAEIVASGAEIAGFSMTFTRRGREFARLIGRCRALGYAGVTVAGGPFAAFHPEALLGDVPALDAVAVGEGERILCDLARDPRRLADVAGLVWRDGATVRRNAPALPEQDLDRLPWPLHRRPFDRYHGLPIANLLGSRGCTHACGFCSIAAWHRLCGGARHRQRRPEGIAAEMGCLWREGVRIFNFHDDNFLGRDPAENLRRADALAEALARQGVGKIAFQIKARPDAVEPRLFARLRGLGLFRVFLGIEAGTEASLRSLGRGQRLDENERALAILEDLDLHIAFNLLVINPDSTLEDLAGNVAFLRAHARTPLNFCRTEIYAETPLERRLRREGRLLGTYWGLDYAIDDPRVRRVFEVYTPAFHERNFGAHPLHYVSGQVDYEHQLRADFFGTTPELRAAAKGYVREVNENTAAYLEEIIAAVTSGEATAAFAERLAARVAADDRRLHLASKAVLARVRAIPAEDARQPRRRTPATLAAAAALALAACSGGQRAHTHQMEAAPPPPPYEGPPDGNGFAQPPPGGQPDAAPIPPHPMEAAPPPPDDDYTHQMEAAPPPPDWGPRGPEEGGE